MTAPRPTALTPEESWYVETLEDIGTKVIIRRLDDVVSERDAEKTQLRGVIDNLRENCRALDAQVSQLTKERDAASAQAAADRAFHSDNTKLAAQVARLTADKVQLGEERRAEWIRAENAEAQVARLRELLRTRHAFPAFPTPGEGLVSEPHDWEQQNQWRRAWDLLNAEIDAALRDAEASK